MMSDKVLQAPKMQEDENISGSYAALACQNGPKPSNVASRSTKAGYPWQRTGSSVAGQGMKD